MKHCFVIAFLLFAFTFVAVENATACSCRYPVGETDKESVDSAKDKANAVFVGRVIKVVRVRDRRGVPLWEKYNAVFEVSEQWKGPIKKQIRVSFFAGCCLCDFLFAKGKEYLVYASGDGTTLSASVCGRTKETSNTLLKIDREFLGSPISTTPRSKLESHDR